MSEVKKNRPKKTKKPDNRPARARYWTNRSLEANKIRRLVRCNGMDATTARRFWRDARKGRIKK